MEKGEGLRRLRDTIDLLFMLEQLTDGLAESDARSHELPWKGIRITLSHSKENILRAYEVLAEIDQSSRSTTSAAQSRSAVAGHSSGFSSLAGRIQRAPTSSAGTVRELTAPPSKGGTKGNREGLSSDDIQTDRLGERG